jgi:microcystin-dependent protein
MEPFIGEIRLFSFPFNPYNWMPCEGQILSISAHSALFSLIGATYGGDGKTNFALPDLRGRLPVHPSAGAPYGKPGGEAAHTLTNLEVPAHTHLAMASSSTVQSLEAGGHLGAVTTKLAYGQSGANPNNYQNLKPVGQGEAHDNHQPSLSLNFCIAITGLFPIRP